MAAATGRLLALVRHAKAESGEERDDHDRRLTGRGRRTADAAGRWLSEALSTVDVVWVSSASRARETWDAMAPVVAHDRVDVDRTLYLAGSADIIERVTGTDVPVQVVVGHNPTLEQVLTGLVGTGRGMRPGAVAVVDLDAGRLVDFWEPSR